MNAGDSFRARESTTIRVLTVGGIFMRRLRTSAMSVGYGVGCGLVGWDSGAGGNRAGQSPEEKTAKYMESVRASAGIVCCLF